MIGILDKLGLIYFWGKIKTWGNNTFVAKENGKGLSTNDYTTAEKNKLNGITAGAEVNVQANWAETDSSDDAFIKNKPTIPSKTSDLTNDSGFITASQVPEGATASSTTPLVDGTAAVGTETTFARGDHRHPTDTSRAADNAVVHLTGNETIAGNKTFSNKVQFNGGSLDTNISLSDGEAELQFWGEDDKGFSWIRESVASSGGTVSQWRSLGTVLNGKVNTSTVGAANGICPLNSSSKIDSTYLPSFVDDVVEAYARSGQTALSSTWLATESASGTVISPESGKIYVLMNDVMSGNDVVYAANSQFRWATNTYVKLNDGGITAITNAEIDQITAN